MAEARQPGHPSLFAGAEPYGLEAVPVEERTARPRDLWWVWVAGNLAFTYVILGAGLWAYGLGLWQLLLVVCLGAASYVLLGAIALPGARHGLPTMALSRYVLGRYGNVPASVLSWLNLVGWESVVLVISAQALATALSRLFTVPPGAFLSLVGLTVTVVLVFGTAFLGYHTVVRVQTLFAYVFGILTLVGVVLTWPHGAVLATLARRPSGPWLTGALPAFALVASATGLSWVNTGADYSRYLGRSGRSAFHATAWGSWVPAAGLLLAGAVLAVRAPGLGTATNPVAALEALVPTWFVIPYLLTAAGGMIAGDILDVYSGGLSLLAAGIRVPRSRTVLADLAVSLTIAVYALARQAAFLPWFTSFLTLLASALAPWAAVYLASLHRLSKPELVRDAPPAVDAGNLVAWLAGLIAAGLTASTALWSGPLARGPFASSALGLLLGFAVAYAIAVVWPRYRAGDRSFSRTTTAGKAAEEALGVRER